MTLRQRQPRQRDSEHLAFVRAQPCCVCPAGSKRKAEAAHIRMACHELGKRAAGGAEKPDDKWSTPLCAGHHRLWRLAQHRISERRFWFEIHRRDPFKIAARLWITSGGDARALLAQAAAPVRRAIKPRRAGGPKRKIPTRTLQSGTAFPAGRKLHGRGFEKRAST